MELNRNALEPVIEQTIALNDLDAPVILTFLTEKGSQQIQTCPGDIYKIVNALMDYSRLLELAIEQWDLQGFHKATYEVHAEKCRTIANKYAAGIGYDYQRAVERCKRKMEKPVRDEGVGEDAIVLAVRKGYRGKQEKSKQTP